MRNSYKNGSKQDQVFTYVIFLTETGIIWNHTLAYMLRHSVAMKQRSLCRSYENGYVSIVKNGTDLRGA